MKKVFINVQKEFCGECSLALMHFIGKMKGVESVVAEDGRVVITFEESEIDEDFLLKTTKESIGEMGYRLVDEQK